MQHPARLDHRLFFWAARRLYRARTAQEAAAGELRRLLVVRVDERVGNLITLQSLIDGIRAGLPGIELGLLASARVGAVVRSLQGVDRLHSIDKRWFLINPGRWHRVVREVRAAGYQVAIDASAWQLLSFIHSALVFFSGAPLRIGYGRGFDSGFHSVTVAPGPAGEYELAQRMRLLKPLGVQAAPPPLRSGLGEHEQVTWEKWLSLQGVARPRVGFWAGSRKVERRWPLSHHRRLAENLRQGVGGSLVILWGPGEEEMRDHLGSVPGSVVAPPTDIPALAGMLRCLDLVVTNDTGPMHLSVAVGTPTVALFVTGDMSRWGHPYPWVRNLLVPVEDPDGLERALQACRELLEQGKGGSTRGGGG